MKKLRPTSRTLSECIEPLTKPVFKKHGLAETRILRDWADIVGPQLARYAIPQKIVRDVLTVAAPSGFATELQYMEPQILERLASYLGSRSIMRIKIQQTAMPDLPEEKHVKPSAPITESGDELTDALARLQAALHNKQ